MNNLSLEILDFIEELAEKYNLDENLEKDAIIKNRLSKATTFGEKQFIKLVFSEDDFPSLILIKIVKKLANNELSFSQLQNEFKEKLLLDENISIQIFQDISNNTLINNLIKKTTGDEYLKENIVKRGLSQELE